MTEITNSLFWLPLGMYLAGWVLEFIRFWRADIEVAHWGSSVIAVGWGGHTIFLIISLAEGEINIELLLGLSAWASMILYYIIQRRYRETGFGYVVPPFAVALLLVAALNSSGSILLPEAVTSPVLTRNLLIIHIVAVMGGLVLFALACLFSVAYLYQERKIKTRLLDVKESRLPSLASLEHLNHKAITLGFFFLSAGILLGVLVSAMHNLPLRLFNWRQIIPALTWLVYAAFLIEHTLQSRRGRFAAFWSIGGFIFVTSALVIELVLVVRE